MKKIGFLAILSFVLFSSISANATAQKPPRGNNYIENGHLYVWYDGAYIDMGAYNPG